MADDTVSTGIEALDVFLKGGLPKGFTSLMLTPAGGGAEIFAKQFAAGAKGDKVTYVTTDESAGEVKQAAREGRWDFSGVEIIDLQTDFAESMLASQERKPKEETAPAKRRFDARDLVEGTTGLDFLKGRAPSTSQAASTDAPDYLGRLLQVYTRLRSPDRLVVHSLDFFLNLYTVEQVVAALTALKAANARQGGLVLWVLSKGAHGPATERRLELLADCLLELEVTRKGTTFERFFMVKKVKNRAYGIGVSTYDIAPEGFQLETLERIV